MKKLILAALLMAAPLAQAGSYFNGYVWVSNICRSGLYYTVLPTYHPVGQTCINSAWGVYGVIDFN